MDIELSRFLVIAEGKGSNHPILSNPDSPTKIQCELWALRLFDLLTLKGYGVIACCTFTEYETSHSLFLFTLERSLTQVPKLGSILPLIIEDEKDLSRQPLVTLGYPESAGFKHRVVANRYYRPERKDPLLQFHVKPSVEGPVDDPDQDILVSLRGTWKAKVISTHPYINEVIRPFDEIAAMNDEAFDRYVRLIYFCVGRALGDIEMMNLQEKDIANITRTVINTEDHVLLIAQQMAEEIAIFKDDNLADILKSAVKPLKIQHSINKSFYLLKDNPERDGRQVTYMDATDSITPFNNKKAAQQLVKRLSSLNDSKLIPPKPQNLDVYYFSTAPSGSSSLPSGGQTSDNQTRLTKKVKKEYFQRMKTSYNLIKEFNETERILKEKKGHKISASSSVEEFEQDVESVIDDLVRAMNEAEEKITDEMTKKMQEVKKLKHKKSERSIAEERLAKVKRWQEKKSRALKQELDSQSLVLKKKKEHVTFKDPLRSTRNLSPVPVKPDVRWEQDKHRTRQKIVAKKPLDDKNQRTTQRVLVNKAIRPATPQRIVQNILQPKLEPDKHKRKPKEKLGKLEKFEKPEKRKKLQQFETPEKRDKIRKREKPEELEQRKELKQLEKPEKRKMHKPRENLKKRVPNDAARNHIANQNEVAILKPVKEIRVARRRKKDQRNQSKDNLGLDIKTHKGRNLKDNVMDSPSFTRKRKVRRKIATDRQRVKNKPHGDRWVTAVPILSDSVPAALWMPESSPLFEELKQKVDPNSKLSDFLKTAFNQQIVSKREGKTTGQKKCPSRQRSRPRSSTADTDETNYDQLFGWSQESSYDSESASDEPSQSISLQRKPSKIIQTLRYFQDSYNTLRKYLKSERDPNKPSKKKIIF